MAKQTDKPKKPARKVQQARKVQRTKPNGPVKPEEPDKPAPVLLNIRFLNLVNAEHYAFCCSFYELLVKSGTSLKDAVTPARIAEFYFWLALEGELMRWAYKSVLTEEIAEADREFVRALRAVGAYVRAAVYSDDRDVADAAKRLRVMLREHGDVSKKAYNEKEGAGRAILDSLHGNYAADVAAIGMEAQTARLQTAFDAFAALLSERDADMEQKPKVKFPAVRRAIGALYRVIAGIINAGAKLGQSQDFPAFIKTFNPEIERRNSRKRRARRDLKYAQIAPIAARRFTGLPVTPHVRVFYGTKEGLDELELGRHFNVTYRHNVEAGNADCIIHGKGDYKGVKTISFIITHDAVEVDAAAAAAAEEEFRRQLLAQAKEAVKAAKAAKAAEKAAKAAAKLEAEARSKARANAKAEALKAAEEAEALANE